MNIKQTTLTQIIDQYDAYLIDLWGVVHDGITVYPGAVECLNYLTSHHKIVLFLSNAPRPGNLLINKLQNLGIKITSDMILTSGDLIRSQLISFNDAVFRNLGKRFYHLGAERNVDILAGLSINLTFQLEEANFILLTAYLEEEENINQYDSLLSNALSFKIPILCANPDKAVIHGNKIRYCAGTIAEKYEKMGGIVHYYGKPHLNIYEAAFKKLQAYHIQDKHRVLMIGDTLETDIRGAHNAHIDSALVLTGNTERSFSQAKTERSINAFSEFLSAQFKKANLSPTWILTSLSL